MGKITICFLLMLITSVGIVSGQDSLDMVSGNTVTQSRLADIVADDYNSKSIPDQQAQVTLSRVTGNSVPQSRTADIVSYDSANSYDGSGSSSSPYVPLSLPVVTSVPAEIINIPPIEIPIPTPTATPVPKITPSPKILRDMAKQGVDYEFSLSAADDTVLWGNFCFDIDPPDAEVRIKGIVHTQLCPSRDFIPGLYRVNISHEGYHNYSEIIELKNEELKPVVVSLQAIKEVVKVGTEVPEQNESVTISAQNNTSIATLASQPENSQSATILAFLSGMAITIIATIIVFKLSRKTVASQDIVTSEDENSDVATNPKTIDDELNKIFGIIKNNPGITDEKILSELFDIYNIKMSGRTLTRRKAELKKNNRL